MPAPSPLPHTWTKTADRQLRSLRKSMGIWLFAHYVGVPVPWEAVRQTDGAVLLAHEHARIQALAAAGEHVPPVLAFTGQQLTVGDVGTTVEHLLHQVGPDEGLRLMCAAGADLARFHARGHWHGGAQVRNLTWDGQRFARLDFEERLRPALPLSTVQAYDALQLLLSLARWLQPLGPSAVVDVLLAYQQAAPTGSDLRGFLSRLLPRLAWIARLAAWVPRLDRSREVMRLRTVLDGMRVFVDQRPAL